MSWNKCISPHKSVSIEAHVVASDIGPSAEPLNWHLCYMQYDFIIGDYKSEYCFWCVGWFLGRQLQHYVQCFL